MKTMSFEHFLFFVSRPSVIRGASVRRQTPEQWMVHSCHILSSHPSRGLIETISVFAMMNGQLNAAAIEPLLASEADKVPAIPNVAGERKINLRWLVGKKNMCSRYYISAPTSWRMKGLNREGSQIKWRRQQKNIFPQYYSLLLLLLCEMCWAIRGCRPKLPVSNDAVGGCSCGAPCVLSHALRNKFRTPQNK